MLKTIINFTQPPIEKPTMTSIDYKSEVLRVEPMAYEHCDSSGYCQIRIAGDMPLTYNIAADNSWQDIAWQSAFFTLKQRGRL